MSTTPSASEPPTKHPPSIKFDTGPQQTVLEAYLTPTEGATVRYDLERELTAGDILTFDRVDGVQFGVGKVVEVSDTAVRNVYPRIVRRNAIHGQDSTQALVQTLNKYYPAAIRLNTPVTTIFYRVLEVDQEAIQCDFPTESAEEAIIEAENSGREQESEIALTSEASDQERPQRGESATSTTNPLTDDDTDTLLPSETVMCAYSDPDHPIEDRWFFAYVDGELKRFHPFNEYAGDTDCIEHRVTHAIDSESIVAVPVERSILHAYQHGKEPTPRVFKEARQGEE